jgi:hypothetical protein
VFVGLCLVDGAIRQSLTCSDPVAYILQLGQDLSCQKQTRQRCSSSKAELHSVVLLTALTVRRLLGLR